MKPHLVVLAAGASERLGECKALVRIGGTCPLHHLVEAGRALGTDNALVIAGADFEAIRAAAPTGCEVVFNPDWRSGRTSSIRLAHALRPQLDLCIAPVDVPLVPAEVFAVLSECWTFRLIRGKAASKSRDSDLFYGDSPINRRLGRPFDETERARKWIAPFTSDGDAQRFGHPVVISCGLLDLLRPDEPLSALRARAQLTGGAVVSTDRIHDDLDTPEDLARLRKIFGA